MGKFDDFYKQLSEVQKKFNELLEKAENNEKKKSNAKANITPVKMDDFSHEDVKQRFFLDSDILSIRNYVYDKLIVQVKDMNAYLDLMVKEGQGYDVYADIFADLSKAIKNFKNGEPATIFAGLVLDHRDEINKKSTEGYKAVIKEFFDEIKDKDYFTEFIKENKNAIYSHSNGFDFSDPEKTKEFFEKNKQFGLDIEVFDMNEVEFRHEYVKDAEEHPYKEKIDLLLNEAKDDKEYADALNEANEIIIEGKAEMRSMSSSIAEKFGQECDGKMLEGAVKYVLEADPETAKLVKYDSSTFALKDINADSLKKVRDEYVNKNETVLTEDFKNGFRDIFNKMKAYGIFNPDTYAAEANFKIYSFNKLVKIKETVEDCVDSKDRDAIINSVKEYRDMEKKYDELLADVKKLSPNEIIPGNISSAREKSVPEKYRNDHIGASKLSGMWQIMGYLDKYHINLDDFLNDPFKVVAENLHKEEESDILLNNYMKGDNIGDIWNQIENKPNITQKVYVMIMSINRVIDPLIRMIPDEETRNKFVAKYYAMEATSYKMAMHNNGLFDYSNAENKREKMMNIMAVEEEDRDARKFTNGYVDYVSGEMTNFDRNKYITEHKNYESILLRAYESKKILLDKYPDEPWANDAFQSSIKMVKLVDTLCKDKTDMIADAVKLMRRNQPLKRTMVENLKSEAAFKKISYKGINNQTIKEATEVYKDLKEKYDHRNFFAKLFYRNVKQQGILVEAYMQVFKNNGYTEKQVNDIIDNKIIIENRPEENNVIQMDKKQLDMSNELINGNPENEKNEFAEKNDNLIQNVEEKEEIKK